MPLEIRTTGVDVKTLPEFKSWRVGDCLLISLSSINVRDRAALQKIADAPTATGFFAILNNIKSIRPHGRYVATADLPAAAGSKDLAEVTTPDWKDWLEASAMSLYEVVLRFFTDRYCEWQVSYPKATTVGGIRSSQDEDNRYTSDDWVRVITTDEYYPKFKLFNQSQYTLTDARAYIEIGSKYGYDYPDKGKIPDVFDTVILSDVQIG